MTFSSETLLTAACVLGLSICPVEGIADPQREPMTSGAAAHIESGSLVAEASATATGRKTCTVADAKAMVGRSIYDIDVLPMPFRLYWDFGFMSPYIVHGYGGQVWIGARTTRDYRPERTNIFVGVRGKVVRATCG